MAEDNTIVYKEEWTVKFQEMLDEPNKFKEICKVEYTNSRVLHNPYLTDATVQSGTRGCPYSLQAVTLTDDNVTISDFKILPQMIDRADLAQQTFVKQMEMAERQGILLNEAIETALYAAHAQYTNFDNASIGGGAGNITVSASNIDNIIRGIKREINEASGQSLFNRNGGFIVWRPADMEILESYMQANGFQTADNALKNGVQSQGFQYMGLTHYSSNLLTANHLMAGVKNVCHLGIVKDTYGQVVVNEEPSDADGTYSAIAVIGRVDYKVKAWNNTSAVLFDVLVA